MKTIQDVRDAFAEVRREYVGKDFNEIAMQMYGDIKTVEDAKEIDRIDEVRVQGGDFEFSLDRGTDGKVAQVGDCMCFCWIKGFCEPDEEGEEPDNCTCYGYNIYENIFNELSHDYANSKVFKYKKDELVKFNKFYFLVYRIMLLMTRLYDFHSSRDDMERFPNKMRRDVKLGIDLMHQFLGNYLGSPMCPKKWHNGNGEWCYNGVCHDNQLILQMISELMQYRVDEAERCLAADEDYFDGANRADYYAYELYKKTIKEIDNLRGLENADI